MVTLLISMLLVDCINGPRQSTSRTIHGILKDGVVVVCNRGATSASCLVDRSLSRLPCVLQICGWLGGFACTCPG